MKSSTVKRALKLSLLVVPFLALPGCGLLDWVKEKTGVDLMPATVQSVKSDKTLVADGSTILVSINGQPAITENELNREFEQLMEENQQLKAILPMMPDAKKNFLQGMINQEVVDKWIEEKGIDKKAEYQKDLARMARSVERMLNTKYFTSEHPVKVSERDAKKFYDDNKEKIQELLVSHGGVKAIGVKFTTEKDAQAFVAKVTAAKGDISKAAQDAKLKAKVTDFKMVNAQSVGIDPKLRGHIVSIKKAPATVVVKIDDKTVWVVRASSKEEATYRPFEQVKAGIMQLVEKEQRMKKMEESINNLKKQYDVIINEAFFKKQAAQQPVLPKQLDISDVVVSKEKTKTVATAPVAQVV